MRSLHLRTDDLGQSTLTSLALPFACFGPTFAPPPAGAPSTQLATAYRSVRALTQANSGGDRHLLIVLSGRLDVRASYTGACLGPGDVLLVEDTVPTHWATPHGHCRLIRLDVTDEWAPAGDVPPALDEPLRAPEAPPLVRRVVALDGQAHLRPFDDLFLDESPSSVSRASFMCLSPGQASDWHTEEATSLVVILSGGFELEVGGDGGAIELFGPGDVFLVQNDHGQGHITRTHGDLRFVAIALTDESRRREER